MRNFTSLRPFMVLLVVTSTFIWLRFDFFYEEIYRVAPQETKISSTLMKILNNCPSAAREDSIDNQRNLLAQDDFESLINLNNFSFILSHFGCENLSQQPQIVIIVYSKPDGFQERQTIRETWGRLDSRSLVLFMLGAVSDEETQLMISNEHMVYNDIIQGNFVDSYHNLTYKHVMGFKWFIFNCPNTNFFFKTDADCFINTPVLFNTIEKFLETHSNPGNLLMGSISHGTIPDREGVTKWKLTVEEYPGDVVPDYTHGFGILYSADVVLKLYKEIQIQKKYIWIEDLFVTGIVRDKVKIPIASNHTLYLSEDDTFNNTVKLQQKEFLTAYYNLNQTKLKELWTTLYEV